jgi:sec-independent protein translocase protein TatC
MLECYCMENITPLKSSDLELIKIKYSPFLKEVRKRIIFILSFFAVSTVAGFIFYEDIIKFSVSLLSLEGINIVFTSPFQFINLSINCGIATGLVFTFPLLIFQVLSFLKPALKIKEFKTVVRFIPFSILLFLIGFIFGAFIMKWQIEIFLAKSVSLGIGNILDISRLLTVVLLTSAIMGIGFQFPIILLILMRIGVVSRSQISKKRPLFYLASFIFTMLLPADSIIADVLLALPLIILFELTIILGAVSIKQKKG